MPRTSWICGTLDPDGGFVLDNNTGPPPPKPTDTGWLGFYHWISDRINPGATYSVPAWQTPTQQAPAVKAAPVDAPRFGAPKLTIDGKTDPPTEMMITVRFYDWLVYESGLGCWVGIGKTNILTVSGDEVKDPVTSKWKEKDGTVLTPAGNGVIVDGGPAGPQFVTWTGFLTATDFNPPYLINYWNGNQNS